MSRSPWGELEPGRPYYPTIIRGPLDSGRGSVGSLLVPACKPQHSDPACVHRWQDGYSGPLCPWCSAAWAYLIAVHGP
ncbi:MAG TPA: hypothetical protein VNO55_31710 [Polyangia bacterium]|nr:hypothetical protein [Polyangia bacterium]